MVIMTVNPANIRNFERFSNAMDEFGGLLIIDNQARIVFISPRFSEFLLNVSAEEALGESLPQFLPQSELLNVLQTGIPQYGRVLVRNGRTIVVSMIPLAENGRIVGAMKITIFSRFEDAREFAQRILGTDKQLDYYKEKVKRLWGAKYSFDSIRGNSLAIIEAKRKQDIAATHSRPLDPEPARSCLPMRSTWTAPTGTGRLSP